MALSDDLQSLRDRVVADLISAHDYYADTIIAWSLVQDVIDAGRILAVRNMTTGTVTTHTSLSTKVEGYIAEQLIEATFQQFLSLFEGFYFDFLRLWLTAYPQSLGRKMVEFKSVLAAADKDAVIQLVVGKELNEVSRRPRPRVICLSTTEGSRIRRMNRRRETLPGIRSARGSKSPSFIMSESSSGAKSLCF